MNISKKIYTLRKQKNITQEYLANILGVSTPAVSKWETGVSMPDINLLAPLARVLNTSIDDLLSYNKELTMKEIDNLIENVKDMCKKDGLRKGMEYAFGILKEYPNSDHLKLIIAMFSTTLAFTFDSDYSEEEFSKLTEKTTLMLQELINSDEYDISMAAKLNVASRYMGDGKFDEAEKILNQFPTQEYNPKHILPRLYLMKEDYVKSLQLSEQNLLVDMQNCFADIHSIFNVKIKQEQFEEALELAKRYRDMVRFSGNSFMVASELLVDTYVLIGDEIQSINSFNDYIEEIIQVEMDYRKSLFFKDIDEKIVVATTEIENDFKTSLFKAIYLNPRYSELRENPKCIEKLEKLRVSLSQ